jgi:hypothetical protein
MYTIGKTTCHIKNTLSIEDIRFLYTNEKIADIN